MMDKLKTHGGKRKGAGRPHGSKTQIKVQNQRPELFEGYTGDMTPLEYMLTVMRDPNAPFDRRDMMAKAAAPYCHAKMADKAGGKKVEAEAAAQAAGQGSEWGDDLTFSPGKAN